ncbi:hypothetical protein ESZ91_04650 [Candidatus Borkfalkia ceftriaxoniphila]|jgi:inner membrane protein oxaA|uniref:Membrane insertase YidC/Oxa/ALB C-terminal domain-containing protein n=1 Tax=Candidatus Borkfalkia ceftriaxoniphila TaxID=2508949 RepID=A0A4Q2KAN0_9FIRM|nr:YidC/Oxa1 family membrane protein insertase [Candidatus Borkfalkia ceftriaxoniphila]RXZ61684.1 hypothetical protein ESZ91_04650 [Candidatus Borkfalkia ceftriaxoniphila]
MLNYLLQSNIITLFFNGDSVSMNWIAKLINGLINAIGIVGVGVVVFTLILKLITLPLDVYSKASMRKNSLKMEKMRPQLEKLQKQYANDQQMYNAKMMELYKKNGYSMLGACLPLIVSLVVFMLVLNAFNSYSRYTDLQVFNQMANDYSAAVLEYAPSRDLDPEPVYTCSEYGKNAEGVMQYKVTMTKTFREDGKYISFEETQTKITTNKDDRDFADTDAYPVSTVYYVETETMVADPSIEESLDALRAEHEGEDDDFICRRYMQNIGRAASEESYHENQVSFLWVKNIWYPDTAFNHPMKNYKDFKSFLGIKDNGNFISETFYNEITANLQSELKEPNGYFILIVVSIGTMFLSQFVMSKSQKAQNELQTANGQGAKTQKIMMIVMPIMFGIFSFMYSAAFSIYMIVSSVFGILSSLGTNFIIDKKYKKLEEKELQEKYNRRIPQSAKSEVITRNEKKKR